MSDERMSTAELEAPDREAPDAGERTSAVEHPAETPIPAETSESAIRMETRNLDFHYGDVQALHGISLAIAQNSVTGLIGPSGCGKSTFLRCLNRMNELIEGTRLTGRIALDTHDIYDKSVDVVD